MSRQTVLERERDFFLNNPLLQGLRSDRWGDDYHADLNGINVAWREPATAINRGAAA